MTTTHAQTSVSTTPVRLATAAIGLGAALEYSFKNLDPSATVWLGSSTVTASGPNIGYPLGPGAQLSASITPGSDLWAVTASGTVIVAELGLN